MSNINQLEAIVFAEGGEVLINGLCRVLGIDTEELVVYVQEYNRLNRGTVLVTDDKVVLMRVSGEYASLVEQIRKDEMSEEISKAGLEVLSIVLYSESRDMSATEVEHIRGVNSGYTLRQLTMRGFLNKARVGTGYRYSPTAELMSFLGVKGKAELPDIEKIQDRVREFKDNKERQDD